MTSLNAAGQEWWTAAIQLGQNAGESKGCPPSVGSLKSMEAPRTGGPSLKRPVPPMGGPAAPPRRSPGRVRPPRPPRKSSSLKPVRKDATVRASSSDASEATALLLTEANPPAASSNLQEHLAKEWRPKDQLGTRGLPRDRSGFS